MKFQIRQEEIIIATSNIARITNQKIENYKFIQIEAVDTSTIQLKATNGIVTMVYTLPAEKVEGESIALNAQKFNEILLRLTGNIKFEDGLITAGKTKIKIPFVENLKVPTFDQELDFQEINADVFKNALKGRLFACDDKDRNIIGGICINGNEVVATNGVVLSFTKLENELPFNKIVIEKKLANEIIKCFDEDTFKIGFTDQKIIVKTDKVVLESFLKVGEYPPYKQIMPKTYMNKFVFDKTKILQSLDLIDLVCDKNKRFCVLDISENLLSIQNINNNSEAQTDIDIDYNGENKQLGFSIELLTNALKNIEGDVVEFNFNQALTACQLTTDKELTIIMPMQFDKLSKK